MFTKEGYAVQGPDQKHFVNEDRAFIDNNQKVFAIFDGAGGSMGGAVASQKCAEVLTSFTNQYYLGGTSDAVIGHLKIAADEMQEALCRNPESRGCCTTGLMAKVSEDNKRLDYICIGDSQLWLIRNGKMQQISTDQGDEIQRNAITNGLGSWVNKEDGTWSKAYTQAPNEGTLELQPNDIVFLSSDGIMGDWDSQKPDEAVLSNIAANAPSQSSDEIANALYNASKKLDDTSVVVLKF